MRIETAAVIALSALSVACLPAADENPIERGRRAYAANCIACHNPDPAREGSLGPPIAGSSLELLEARILRAEYPPGYTPKRDSGLMPAQPYLKREIPDLAAYLGSLGKK